MRQPATDRYDALVDLQPCPPGEIPGYAYALAKFTYQVLADGRVVPKEPEPLLFDVYRDATLEPRMPPGSDYWVQKRATDVVLRGSAFMPGGKPGSSMQVSATLGALTKRIAVFGRRALDWRAGGQVSIGAAEPFTEMPIIYPNAYGGIDPRVPLPPEDEEQWQKLARLGLAFDHPGLYPRNPGGKGYLVYPDPPMRGVELPNLEDPDDLLTLSRLFAHTPERWYQQPLPWFFDWTDPLMYPRELHGGLDAWFPCPDPSRLPEVLRGFAPPDLARASGPARPEFYQEASLGMVARTRLAGAPVTIVGMHPEEPSLSFRVPEPVPMTIELEGRPLPTQALLSNFVIFPATKTFYLVYCARTLEDLPRAFVPEIHADIPLSVRIGTDAPLRYETPATIRERLVAANHVSAS